MVIIPQARPFCRQLGDLHLSQPIVTGVMSGYRRLIARFLGIEDATPVTVEVIDSGKTRGPRTEGPLYVARRNDQLGTH